MAAGSMHPDGRKNTKKNRKPKGRPATLADVAREAGVVAMTASRAINDSGYVSNEVRARVLKVASKLRYRPNILARQLKLRRLNTVGVVLPDVSNPFSTELLEGMKTVLEQKGYTAFVTTTGRRVDQEVAGLRALVDHRVDGLLIATRGTRIGDALVREVVRNGPPVVTIGRPIDGVALDCITADHWQGAFDAVSHLIELGHTRIGFIGISHHDRYTLRRFQGYEAALEQNGIMAMARDVVGPSIAPAFATQEDGYGGMVQLLRLKRPPTAVFARNDFAAIGALRAAHEAGLRVPDDIAIAGFDDIPLAAYTTPTLTTVRQPIAEQGQIAARMLLDRIEGRAGKKTVMHRIECQLVIRESTSGCPASPHAGS
jgi:DNA-binding LacI/PurR family transcriptional regulator